MSLMPLDRANVTAASRIMLPTYVAAFVLLGLGYLFVPDLRAMQNPPLAYADDLLPLPMWGVMFLFAGATMAAAMLTRRRVLARWALMLGAVCMFVWTVVFIVAAFNSATTPVAWVYPAVIAVACLASNESLTKGEM